MSTKKTLELEYKIAILENHIDSLQRRFDSLEQTMYALHNSRFSHEPSLNKRGSPIKHMKEDYVSDIENSEFHEEQSDDGTNEEIVPTQSPQVSSEMKKGGEKAKTFIRSIS